MLAHKWAIERKLQNQKRNFDLLKSLGLTFSSIIVALTWGCQSSLKYFRPACTSPQAAFIALQRAIESDIARFAPNPKVGVRECAESPIRAILGPIRVEVSTIGPITDKVPLFTCSAIGCFHSYRQRGRLSQREWYPTTSIEYECSITYYNSQMFNQLIRNDKVVGTSGKVDGQAWLSHSSSWPFILANLSSEPSTTPLTFPLSLM